MKDKPLLTLVTGANKGIGFSSVEQLLRMGHKVYLTARDETRGHEAVRRLQAQGFSDVDLLIMDVADPDSVNKAAAMYATLENRLDVLINNAGIGGLQPQATSSVHVN